MIRQDELRNKIIEYLQAAKDVLQIEAYPEEVRAINTLISVCRANELDKFTYIFCEGQSIFNLRAMGYDIGITWDKENRDNFNA